VTGLSDVTPTPADALTDAAPTIISTVQASPFPTPAASPVAQRETVSGR